VERSPQVAIEEPQVAIEEPQVAIEEPQVAIEEPQVAKEGWPGEGASWVSPSDRSRPLR
jgi:hypothetical protein